ncbi:unnamed protein product, partial [Allacma fusca]
SVIFAESLIV